MNERVIELVEITPKDFWGAQDVHLEAIKKYYPKLKIVARGTIVKAYGEEEILDEFETRFRRLMLHFTRFNSIDENVILRVLESSSQETQYMQDSDKILVHGVGGKLIKAMTPNQQKLVDYIHKMDMVFAIGPAGTGKTYTGVAMAVKALKEKQVKRIILTRPAVEAGENLGFLPGDMKEKLDPYIYPSYYLLNKIIGKECREKLKDEGYIEVAALAYMRGWNVDNTILVFEEAQNATPAQIKLLLTRIGYNSKFFLSGDLEQSDKFKDKTKSGLYDAKVRLEGGVRGVGVYEFGTKDIVRNPIISEILKRYE